MVWWGEQALHSGSVVGYLRLDAKPTKQAIITWVSRWTYLFTAYLQSKVNAVLLNINGIHVFVVIVCNLHPEILTHRCHYKVLACLVCNAGAIKPCCGAGSRLLGKVHRRASQELHV